MRVIGIDPSLGGFAVACASADVEPAQWSLSRHGTKPAQSVIQRVRRYRSIARFAVEHVQAHQAGDRVELVAIEGYSFASKGSATHSVMELGGVLRDRLAPIAPVLEVPPSTLKKWATGKGNADKTSVATELALRFKRSFANNDEADAFGLASLALAILDDDHLGLFPKVQRAVALGLRDQARALREEYAALCGAA